MNRNSLSIIVLVSLLNLLILNCSSKRLDAEGGEITGHDPMGEIIFHTNGSVFSPVIVLDRTAEVTWIWNDSTTSNVTNPTKNYETSQLRQNRLKVKPWSALRRINIGYDGGDGGNPDIEFVTDQQVSMVENLELAAPYLIEWCSSYNSITSLNFDNFTKLETIECYLSGALKNISLQNTPRLKRLCLENNDLVSLDLSDCNSLEDLRGALNNYPTIIFPDRMENLWHLCVGGNPQINNSHLFSDFSKFPNLFELIISDTNQEGSLIISSTPGRRVDLNAERNNYSSLSLKGALQNSRYIGNVYMPHNQFTSVDISGCIQISQLNLSDNKLDSEAIDHVLRQVDNFGTSNGTIDLRQNMPPTEFGIASVTNLKNRGWTVFTDEITTGSIQNMDNTSSFNIYFDASDDKTKVTLNKVPNETLTLKKVIFFHE